MTANGNPVHDPHYPLLRPIARGPKGPVNVVTKRRGTLNPQPGQSGAWIDLRKARSADTDGDNGPCGPRATASVVQARRPPGPRRCGARLNRGWGDDAVGLDTVRAGFHRAARISSGGVAHSETARQDTPLGLPKRSISTRRERHIHRVSNHGGRVDHGPMLITTVTQQKSVTSVWRRIQQWRAVRRQRALERTLSSREPEPPRSDATFHRGHHQ